MSPEFDAKRGSPLLACLRTPWLALCCVWYVVGASPLAHAQADDTNARGSSEDGFVTAPNGRDHAFTSGLSVLAGAGYAAGSGVGGQLGYTHEWGHPRLRVTEFVDFGYEGRKLDGRAFLGYGAGALLSFGKRNRMYVDLSLASTWYRLADAFESRVWSLLVGMGYEVVSPRGFVSRVGLAAGPNLRSAPLLSREDRVAVAANFVMGWKLW